MFSPPLLRRLVEDVGAEHVLLGTDHPFELGDNAPLETVRRLGLDAGASRAILWDSAAALLGSHGGRSRNRLTASTTSRGVLPEEQVPGVRQHQQLGLRHPLDQQPGIRGSTTVSAMPWITRVSGGDPALPGTAVVPGAGAGQGREALAIPGPVR